MPEVVRTDFNFCPIGHGDNKCVVFATDYWNLALVGECCCQPFTDIAGGLKNSILVHCSCLWRHRNVLKVMKCPLRFIWREIVEEVL